MIVIPHAFWAWLPERYGGAARASWNVLFVTKSNSQRLKKGKKFAFRNSPFTRQHNISLNGTKYIKDMRSRVSVMFYQQPNMHFNYSQ